MRAISSNDENPPGLYPPNSTAFSVEICVSEKSLRGGGMSPVMVGTVHSSIKQGNTTHGTETMHVIPEE